MKIKSYILFLLFVANLFVPSKMIAAEAMPCCKLEQSSKKESKGCCSKHQEENKKQNNGCKCVHTSSAQVFISIEPNFNIQLNTFVTSENVKFQEFNASTLTGFTTIFALPKIG
jgi:hypothetical protein